MCGQSKQGQTGCKNSCAPNEAKCQPGVKTIDVSQIARQPSAAQRARDIAAGLGAHLVRDTEN